MPHTPGHAMTSPEMQQCIDECLRCSATCTRTVQHCLELGGEHAEPGHITTLIDCADICQSSANFMLRGSQFHARICVACAEVCRTCEQECRRMGDDEMMRQCAEECLRCADSCDRMAGTAAAQ